MDNALVSAVFIIVIFIFFSLTGAPPKSFPSNKYETLCGKRPNPKVYAKPWVVKIRKKRTWRVVCIGILIERHDFKFGSDLILTSADCARQMNTKDKFVAQFSDDTTAEILQREYVTEEYIGFAKLQQPAMYSESIQPICLPADAKQDPPPNGMTMTKFVPNKGQIGWKATPVQITKTSDCLNQWISNLFHSVPQFKFCVSSKYGLVERGAPCYAYNLAENRYTLWGIFDRSSDTSNHLFVAVAGYLDSVHAFIADMTRFERRKTSIIDRVGTFISDRLQAVAK